MNRDPLVFLLLSLAAWRTWVLFSRDSILDWLRDDLPQGVRDFLACAYCSGFWIAGAWVTLWVDTRPVLPGFVTWMLWWWAVAAGVVIVEALVDRLTASG